LQVPKRNDNKTPGQTPVLFIQKMTEKKQTKEKKPLPKIKEKETKDKEKKTKKISNSTTSKKSTNTKTLRPLKTTEKKSTTKSKLEELKAKAKELEKKVKGSEKIDIKGKLTGEPTLEEDTLVPIEDYLKSSIHLGTRVITPHMKKFVYKRRGDGLAVFNTNLIDKMLREGTDYICKFAPEDIVIVCKREAGWDAVKKFAKLTGIKSFTKKYPAGTLTNIKLEDFFEKELLIICDPWLDKNALKDANKVKMKVLSICDSNNYAFGIDKFIIGNNKSAKSLGIILFLLSKIYIEKRNLKVEPLKVEDFIENWDELIPPK
jgi:small subunit ribosomal protein S2